MILFSEQYFTIILEVISSVLLGFFAFKYYQVMSETESTYLKYVVITAIVLLLVNLFLAVSNIIELFDYTPTKSTIELVYSIVVLLSTGFLAYSTRDEEFDEEQSY